MRMRMLAVGCLVALLGVAGFASDGAPKKDCCALRLKAQGPETAARAERLRCSLTGQEIDACCCVQREGKTHCTLAGKDVGRCCCHPVGEPKREHATEK